MAAESTSQESTLFKTPATASWIGLLLALAAGGIQMATCAEWSPIGAGISVVLAYAAMIVGGFGVAARPKNVSVLLVAALTSLIAMFGVYEEWDAIRILPMAMTGVAVVVAVLLVLPRPLQLAIVSGMAVFHFFGILSAITSPPPQSWLSNWAWTTLFRPHLVFCYTNNAYQFYSPEPGPACLLWFCIESTDGQRTWIKLPRKPDTSLDPLAVEFFRRLSITEAVNQNEQLVNPPPEVIERRQAAAGIPLHPQLVLNGQYRLPQPNTRRTISSYVRHIAHKFGPENVRSIKMYRVLHDVLRQPQFAAGADPFDQTTYYPYFLGEYGPDGLLLEPNDPLLFWVIPIYRKDPVLGTIRPKSDTSGGIENFLAVHAGSDPFLH